MVGENPLPPYCENKGDPECVTYLYAELLISVGFHLGNVTLERGMYYVLIWLLLGELGHKLTRRIEGEGCVHMRMILLVSQV